MRKRVRDFQQEVFEAVRGREYVSLPPILYERFISTVKLRFRIKKIHESFIQFYYNDDNGKTSMTLVVKGKGCMGTITRQKEVGIATYPRTVSTIK